MVGLVSTLKTDGSAVLKMGGFAALSGRSILSAGPALPASGSTVWRVIFPAPESSAVGENRRM